MKTGDKPDSKSKFFLWYKFTRSLYPKIWLLIIPATLSFLAALLEGVFLALLVPLVSGFVQMDFTSLKYFSTFRKISNYFPSFNEIDGYTLFGVIASLIIVATIGKNILSYLASLSSNLISQGFVVNLREALFDRYLKYGLLYFEKNKRGRLVHILVGFTLNFGSYLGALQTIFIFSVNLLIYLGLMLYISWPLTLTLGLTLPLLPLSSKWLIKKIRITSKAIAEPQKMIADKALETLSAMPLIKMSGTAKKESSMFVSLCKNFAGISFSMTKKTALLHPLQEITSLGIILVSGLIYVLFLNYTTQPLPKPATFLVFFYIFKRTINVVSQINGVRSSLARLTGPADDIIETLADEGKYIYKGGVKKSSQIEQSISMRDLSFSYTDDVPVLKNLNLTFEKGKTTAMVGASGAGKSTIIKLILRLYDCPLNTIFVDGVDIKRFSIDSLMSKFSVVSQDIHLFNDTLRNNVLYGIKRKVTKDELDEVFKKVHLYDWVMTLPRKWQTEVGERGMKLSGGQVQRVAIARAFLKNADVLILDEASNALDSKTERHIQQALKHLMKNKTAIVIAHRLSTITHADKIAVIHDGQVVEEGKIEQLLENKGPFYEYWEAQKMGKAA